MKNRRGSSLWPETDGLSSMIYRFEPGDIVIPVAVQQSHFLGVVKEVMPKINKIMVLWNGGCLKQHDPDEIMLEAHQNEIVRTRMASSRRSKGKSAEKIIAAKKTFDDLPDSEKAVAKKMAAKGYKYVAQITTSEGKFGEPLYFKSADAVGPFLRSFPDYANAKTEWVAELPADIVKASENFEFAGSRRGSVVLSALKESVESPVPHGEQFVGDPKTHGIDSPRGGGFSIMQDLQKDLHREQKESEAGPKIAGGGMSPEQLYRGIRNGLLAIARKVSRLFPNVNLRYGDRQLTGTVAGHDVKVFYDIYRASNGEVAGLPVIVLDGKRYDKFYRNVEDKLQELLSQVVMASEKTAMWETKTFKNKKEMDEWIRRNDSRYQWQEIFINQPTLKDPSHAVEYRKLRQASDKTATGEMGYHDIQPGGEHHEWAKMIESAAKQLQRLSHNLTRFQGMKPFDVYRGPYAQMNNAKLWSSEGEGEYFFDLFQGGSYGHRMGPANPNTSVRGSVDEIADWLIDFHKKSASDYSGLRSRRAMYWGAPERIYRLTKDEQENGMAVCPRCKAEMQKEPFTKSEKLYSCPKCGFKVPSSKTTTTKIEIEVQDGKVTDVDVTTARRVRKSSLAKEVLETGKQLSGKSRRR